MRCPSCRFENPEGMAFCTECGARLQKSCQGCGFENASQAKFCGKCGTALQAEGPPEPAMSRTRKGTRVTRRAAHPSPRPTAVRPRPVPPEAERH